MYTDKKIPIRLILTPFFPIEWVPVPVPMGRKKSLVTDFNIKSNFIQVVIFPLNVHVKVMKVVSYKHRKILE